MKREELLFGSLLLGGVAVVVGLAFFLSPKKERPAVWGGNAPKASFESSGVPYERATPTRRAQDPHEAALEPVDLSSIKDPEKRERVEKLLDGGKWIRTVDAGGNFYLSRPVTMHGLGPGGKPRTFNVSMRPGLVEKVEKLDPTALSEGAKP